MSDGMEIDMGTFHLSIIGILWPETESILDLSPQRRSSFGHSIFQATSLVSLAVQLQVLFKQFFKQLFMLKCMPMIFFYFLKIIFDISTSKRSKKYKPHSILAKNNNNSNLDETQVQTQYQTFSQCVLGHFSSDQTFLNVKNNIKVMDNCLILSLNL